MPAETIDPATIDVESLGIPINHILSFIKAKHLKWSPPVLRLFIEGIWIVQYHPLLVNEKERRHCWSWISHFVREQAALRNVELPPQFLSTEDSSKFCSSKAQTLDKHFQSLDPPSPYTYLFSKVSGKSKAGASSSPGQEEPSPQASSTNSRQTLEPATNHLTSHNIPLQPTTSNSSDVAIPSTGTSRAHSYPELRHFDNHRQSHEPAAAQPIGLRDGSYGTSFTLATLNIPLVEWVELRTSTLQPCVPRLPPPPSIPIRHSLKATANTPSSPVSRQFNTVLRQRLSNTLDLQTRVLAHNSNLGQTTTYHVYLQVTLSNGAPSPSSSILRCNIRCAQGSWENVRACSQVYRVIGGQHLIHLGEFDQEEQVTRDLRQDSTLGLCVDQCAATWWNHVNSLANQSSDLGDHLIVLYAVNTNPVNPLGNDTVTNVLRTAILVRFSTSQDDYHENMSFVGDISLPEDFDPFTGEEDTAGSHLAASTEAASRNIIARYSESHGLVVEPPVPLHVPPGGPGGSRSLYHNPPPGLKISIPRAVLERRGQGIPNSASAIQPPPESKATYIQPMYSHPSPTAVGALGHPFHRHSQSQGSSLYQAAPLSPSSLPPPTSLSNAPHATNLVEATDIPSPSPLTSLSRSYSYPNTAPQPVVHSAASGPRTVRRWADRSVSSIPRHAPYSMPLNARPRVMPVVEHLSSSSMPEASSPGIPSNSSMIIPHYSLNDGSVAQSVPGNLSSVQAMNLQTPPLKPSELFTSPDPWVHGRDQPDSAVQYNTTQNSSWIHTADNTPYVGNMQISSQPASVHAVATTVSSQTWGGLQPSWNHDANRLTGQHQGFTLDSVYPDTQGNPSH